MAQAEVDDPKAKPQPTTIAVSEGLTVHITQRTGGRIKGLRVTRTSGSLILNGTSSTYYGKQLAQHAAHELFPELRIVNEIYVEPIPLLHFKSNDDR